jgi:hypothetical protein
MKTDDTEKLIADLMAQIAALQSRVAALEARSYFPQPAFVPFSPQPFLPQYGGTGGTPVPPVLPYTITC